MQIMTALFPNHDKAADAIAALIENGIDKDAMTLISAADEQSAQIRELINEAPQKTAVSGAAAGGVTGSLLGLLGGIFLMPLPGVGPVLASGMITSAAGGVLGGYLGSLYALRAESQSEIDIKEALTAGKLLLAVNIENDNSKVIAQSLKEAGGEHIEQHDTNEQPV